MKRLGMLAISLRGIKSRILISFRMPMTKRNYFKCTLEEITTTTTTTTITTTTTTTTIIIIIIIIIIISVLRKAINYHTWKLWLSPESI